MSVPRTYSCFQVSKNGLFMAKSRSNGWGWLQAGQVHRVRHIISQQWIRKYSLGLLLPVPGTYPGFHVSKKHKPGPRIPPGACQLIFKVARSLQKRVFCDNFKIGWFDGLTFRIKTTNKAGGFPNFEKELIRGKKVGIFYLGACDVTRSLQARLAGSHGF